MKVPRLALVGMTIHLGLGINSSAASTSYVARKPSTSTTIWSWQLSA
jgi:hypothetical protein